MESHQNKPFLSIKTKLTVTLALSSFSFTLFIILFISYSEYHQNLTTLDQKLHQINESNVPSISLGLWNLDYPYLNEQAESIVRIEDIIEVKILLADNQIFVHSTQKETPLLNDKDFKFYEFPLYHVNKTKAGKEYLGKVVITATTQYIKSSLVSRISNIALLEIVKTFLLSCLFLITIHYLINKNIEKVLRFTNQFDPDLTKGNELDLGRSSSHRDEIDSLQFAINRMGQRLLILNQEKEIQISEQEKKIEIQQAAAITSSKMAALGIMAGGIAHEINNPLSIIHTHVEVMERMIKKSESDPVSLLKSLETINKTIDRIVGIITGLRNISRTVPDRLDDNSSLHDILGDVISMCESQLKLKRIEIICDLESPIFKTNIKCNRVQLSQVFLNLFNNSHDAIESLPIKWIKIEGSVEQGNTHNWLTVNFIDSGEGIPENIRQHLFQPFYTTKEVGKGTGLGLSLIYAMIKNHDGEIFYNENLKNTCFTIKLIS